MAQGPFRNRVCHLSDALFRNLLGLAARANRMVIGLSVYQPSTGTGRTWAHEADSRVLPLPSPYGTDSSDTAGLRGTRSSGFLNRVRWLDSTSSSPSRRYAAPWH
jgi:hypothetical protein